jgi:hypothetical protein
MCKGVSIWAAAVCFACIVTIGCSSSARREHDVLLDEYQRIADRAVALVRTNKPTDPSVVAEVTKLAEKAVAVRHKMLTLQRQPTPQQVQRCEAIATKFQAALHAACPKCPGANKGTK